MSLDAIKEFPEISFIEHATLEDVQFQMVHDFQEKYKELTGMDLILGKADPNRLVLYACALQIYQTMQYIDNAGKQNFLKYAYDGNLDNLGAWKGIQRSKGTAAVVTIKFTLSAAQKSAVLIPAGTRVTAGDNVFFYVTDTAEIPSGQTEQEVSAACTEIGAFANGYEIGKINTLVDLIAYIESVSNTTVSEGGTDAEGDEALAERIYLAPSSYSVAGPDEAYAYWAKTFLPSIIDVKVTSPSPGVVDIRFITEGGELPQSAMLEELTDLLSDKKIRPLTDQVQVQAPDTVDYNIQVKYYINESNRAIASAIQAKVNQAIENYKEWQQIRIGRDINPSVLSQMILQAGAKRTEVAEPVFTVIPETSLANLLKTTVEYGGLEHD